MNIRTINRQQIERILNQFGNRTLTPIFCIEPYEDEMGVVYKVVNSETEETFDDGFESSADAEMYCLDNELELYQSQHDRAVFTVCINAKDAVKLGWILTDDDEAFDFDGYYFFLEVRGNGSTFWWCETVDKEIIWDKSQSGDDEQAIKDISYWSENFQIVDIQLNEASIPYFENTTDRLVEAFNKIQPTYKDDFIIFLIWEMSKGIAECGGINLEGRQVTDEEIFNAVIEEYRN